jgi:hypothetical protein
MAPAQGHATDLLVVEEAGAITALPPGAILYEAASGRFRDANGAVVRPPREVARAWFLTDTALAPADVIALHARGVRWSRALDRADAAALDPGQPMQRALRGLLPAPAAG